MEKYKVHNRYSFSVRNTNQLLEVREQIAGFIKKGGFSSSEQTLINSAVSEVSRHFLKQISGIDIFVGEARHKGRWGVSVTFRAPHSERDLFQSEDDIVHSDKTNFSQVVDGELNRLGNIFDEAIPDTATGSDPSFTITKWVRDDVHLWA